MHLRTGNKFEYNVPNEYHYRSEARDFCSKWSDGEGDLLWKLYDDYLKTDANDDKTKDPVSTKAVVEYLADMDKRFTGLPTFEADRESFTDFLSYAVRLGNLEKLQQKFRKAIEFADSMFGETYYRDIQTVFGNVLDEHDRNKK
ncbi:hypothetical protein P10VF_244 [Rhizobium phage vB_RleM_P10VF]|uniref:Uncharacterized protein n=1 Tax=Rhizobium phage vB_RleM_P10VF TaxID=1527770 RepID=A0A076YL04_9CAUD|nr:hypothetical protein P10VF_244 [Rhizobium phage vB_RleM_P10VF]AIK68457.1 hypothetical protein P10VF_244 [Rhizobium phage vB_RleM_P10VF]